MQQRLHLLIVDRERRAALSARYGSRWLFPSIRCAERSRAGPLISGWLAQMGVIGSLAGQWLGRFVPLTVAIDWLTVVDARPTERAALAEGLSWTALDDLRSSESLLEYQQWAFDRALAGELPVRPGPFGSLEWIDRVRAWAARVAGPLGAPPLCYRATPYEIVIGCSCAGRRVYIKGLAGERIAEAELTVKLAAALPDAFAPTIALEKLDGDSVWWMTEGCAGTPLAADMDKVTPVVSALAHVQRTVADLVPSVVLDELDLTPAVAWGREFLDDHGHRDGMQAARLVEACESVTAGDVPRRWTPLDIDAGNVLVEDDRVRFIDLDRSYLAPAPIAVATLLRRSRRASAESADPGCIDAVRRRYERQSQPMVPFGPRWRDFDLASVLLECHAGWQRLLQNVERGEVSGSLDVAAERTAQRLMRAVIGRRGAD